MKGLERYKLKRQLPDLRLSRIPQREGKSQVGSSVDELMDTEEVHQRCAPKMCKKEVPSSNFGN